MANTKNPKQIFYLLACDEWKSRSSTSLVCITTSATKMRNAIAREIELDNMEYDAPEGATSKEQADKFRRDWEKETRDVINSRLSYGLYDYAYDGEII